MLRKSLAILTLVAPAAAFGQVEPNQEEVRNTVETWRNRQNTDELKRSIELQERVRARDWGQVCDVQIPYFHLTSRVIMNDPIDNLEEGRKAFKVGDQVKLAYAIVTPPPKGWSDNQSRADRPRYWPRPDKNLDGEYLTRVEWFLNNEPVSDWTYDQDLEATAFEKRMDPHLHKFDKPGTWKVRLTLVKKAEQNCESCKPTQLIESEHLVTWSGKVPNKKKGKKKAT